MCAGCSCPHLLSGLSLTTCQFTYLPGVLQNVGNNSLDSDVSRTTGASSPFSVADGNITGGVEQEGPDAGIYQSGYCAALMCLDVTSAVTWLGRRAKHGSPCFASQPLTLLAHL